MTFISETVRMPLWWLPDYFLHVHAAATSSALPRYLPPHSSWHFSTEYNGWRHQGEKNKDIVGKWIHHHTDLPQCSIYFSHQAIKCKCLDVIRDDNVLHSPTTNVPNWLPGYHLLATLCEKNSWLKYGCNSCKSCKHFFLLNQKVF